MVKKDYIAAMTDTQQTPQPSSPPPQAGARRRKLVPLLLVAMLGAGIWAWHGAASGSKDSGKPRTMTVPVALAQATKADIDVIERGLGTVTPLASVTVRTRIDGHLQELAFAEGQTVKEGDLLAQIDARPYEATLAQLEGTLKKDQALLTEARLDLERYRKLSAQDSIAKQKLDAQISTVQQYEGAVAADEAQVAAAKLNIAYCRITAPISGRVGLRQVDVGNYVQTGDTNGLVTLTQMDPMSVLFTLPEDKVPAVMAGLAAGRVLKAVAYDRAQKTKLAEGALVSVDNQIDTSTGTVKLRAQFDNASGALFPNQFVNIDLTVDTLRAVMTVPQAAILRGAPGTFVYVAKDDGKVSMRTVKLGPQQGDVVAVLEGVAEGDKVVTDGTDKLRDGAPYKLPEPTAKDGGKAPRQP